MRRVEKISVFPKKNQEVTLLDHPKDVCFTCLHTPGEGSDLKNEGSIRYESKVVKQF